MSALAEDSDPIRLSPPENRSTANRNLSRSPHPYHRRSASITQHEPVQLTEALIKDDTSESSTERGTEADDEKGPLLLKGLPAPPLRARKGLRGSKSPIDLTPAISPLPTPPGADDGRRSFFDLGGQAGGKHRARQRVTDKDHELYNKYILRRQAEVARRLAETALLVVIGLITCKDVLHILQRWRIEICATFVTIALLCAVYPLRISIGAIYRGSRPRSAIKSGFRVPSRFDLGPLLYPAVFPFLIAVSVADQHEASIIVNLVLGLSSIPSRLIPLLSWSGTSSLQWAVSLMPVFGSQLYYGTKENRNPISIKMPNESALVSESLSLLFPLHQVLLILIRYLTTTSLDLAEIHLLSVGLINLFLFALSPQAQILKAAIWLGGLLLLVFCQKVLAWEIALARIPVWKFTRNKSSKTGVVGKLENLFAVLLPNQRQRKAIRLDSEDEDYDHLRSARKYTRTALKDASGRRHSLVTEDITSKQVYSKESALTKTVATSTAITDVGPNVLSRAATLPTSNPSPPSRTRPRRRSVGSQRSGLLALSYTQAQILKWLIAVYVYIAVVLILMLGIRTYVGTHALYSREPFGWAIGYLLGNIPSLRLWIVSNNLERWIALPQYQSVTDLAGSPGRMEVFRQTTTGAANMRLLISGYCLTILALGLGVVLRLKSVVEVDTRRKVFHGIMVAMLLPTIVVDPCFVALALMVILAVFLLLDLFRASQLPPVSKPLTTFLAPYVDGRDYRGPVIVSHIFLLIGCAIPLWLSLAGSSRSGHDPWAGWEVQARDLSMISGVVCVGMGDAAASLIGRRFGKTKWFWGGGKSLEGSFAFAVAVTTGLMASYAWLRVGGWASWDVHALPGALFKACVAASGASLLESVLTAANDNVVVPIGLWLLVRGLHL